MKGQTDRWSRRVDRKGLGTITPVCNDVCKRKTAAKTCTKDGFEYRLRDNKIKNELNCRKYLVNSRFQYNYVNYISNETDKKRKKEEDRSENH